jgi:CheY-like chemotaxis protein
MEKEVLPPSALSEPLILLVEDDKPNIMVACYALEALGYAYNTASNGTEAIEKFKAGSYSVVLMDVRMPELDGFNATKLIRQHELSLNMKRTPIIGMTAYALLGDRQRCMAAGMDDYIAKPVAIDELKYKLALYIHQNPLI